MEVKCPECEIILSHIRENDNDMYMVRKEVKCICGHVYSIEYPSGSRHQFNALALADTIDRSTLNIMGG